MSITTNQAMDYLIIQAGKLNVSYIAEPVLSNPKFPLWTGASKPHQHHYGKGLLAVHTAEVAKIALTTNQELDYGLPTDRLFLSCLYHDVGKLWDYEPEFRPEDNAICGWKGTDHKRKIYHIQRSALVWNEVATKQRLDEDFKDDVLHAILAHHGMPEWGSPVGPNTKLAWLVHLADNISARMYDCDTWDITRQ